MIDTTTSLLADALVDVEVLAMVGVSWRRRRHCVGGGIKFDARLGAVQSVQHDLRIHDSLCVLLFGTSMGGEWL